MTKDFAPDWLRAKIEADKYLPAVTSVVSGMIGDIVSVNVLPSDYEADVKCATDYIVRVDAGDIACRVRYRDNCPWRELTIRSRLASGTKTELAKLREGFGRWYLYAWADRGNYDIFPEWVWIDLDRLRSSGLMEKQRREIRNYDSRTWFIAITLKELMQADVILKAELAQTAGLIVGNYMPDGAKADVLCQTRNSRPNLVCRTPCTI